MLEGKDVELNSYKYLWAARTPNSDSQLSEISLIGSEQFDKNIKDDFKIILERNLMHRFKLDVKNARKLVRKAVVAFTNETCVEKLNWLRGRPSKRCSDKSN